MNTLQFYKISALALFVLNVALMGFFFLNSQKPPHGREHHFLNKAIKILQLNEEQVEKFEALAKKHNQEMESLQTNQLEWTTKYFELTKDKNKSDSILNLIKEGEVQKIKITKKHFEDIKNMLTNQQLPNYQLFKKEALSKILLQKKPIISK